MSWIATRIACRRVLTARQPTTHLGSTEMGLPRVKVVRRRGREYRYYRHADGSLTPLPVGLPESSAGFVAAHAAAAQLTPVPAAPAGRPGTVARAVCDYLRSRACCQLATSTQAARRRVFARIVAERGDALVCEVSVRHLKADVRGRSAGSARNRIQCWRALFEWLDLEENPAAALSYPSERSQPYRRWTRAEIERFRSHWPDGSPQRGFFEVAFWTAARAGDTCALTVDNVQGSLLSYRAAKNKVVVAVPLRGALPAWCASFAPDQEHALRQLPVSGPLVPTSSGRPRSPKAASQWFTRAVRDAGLPADLSAHGLRKARASLCAEVGASAHQIQAWLGDRTLKMAELYTREADRLRVILGADFVERGNSILDFPEDGGNQR